MSDENAPPPLPEAPPPPPVSSAGVALAIVALVGGLLLLIPGGLCSVMALGMFGGSAEERGYGCVVAVIGVPALAVGIGLLIFGARRLRRSRSR